MNFTVNFQGQSFTLNSPTPSLDFLSQQGISLEAVVAIRINGVLSPLTAYLNRSCTLELVKRHQKESVAILRHTLGFLVGCVADKLFPHHRLVIQRSVPLGYEYRLESSRWQKGETQRLQAALNALREESEVIGERLLSYQEVKSLKDSGECDEKTYKLLQFIPKDEFTFYQWQDSLRFSFYFLTPFVNQLPPIKVIEEPSHCTICFEKDPQTDEPKEFVKNPTLAQVYYKGNQWGKISKVETVGDLNQCIYQNKVSDFIRVNETLQENALAEAAAQIRDRGKDVKAILLAGPSSSGKTTTLKRLCTQLEVLGYHTIALSLDNYYLSREEIPRNEKGELDFECLEALDVKLIQKQLSDFFKGETIEPPIFDFVTGRRKVGKALVPQENSLIVIEGIHGLNPRLLPKEAAERVFKFYLSALPQLRIDNRNRISATDNRLLRRMVRDSKYRGTSAEKTLSMWPSVVEGEQKYIFPYQSEADIAFNSSLDYELSVLKVYSEPLLRSIQSDSPYFDDAQRLLNLISLFLSIPAQDVPTFSLLREFIGDSGFSY